MGIWIRSQDKSVLVNANAIHTYQGRIYASQNDVSGGNIDSGYIVGEYESEEETMAVIDRIHNVLTDCIEYGYGKTQRADSERSMVVFQMPEQGFIIEKSPTKGQRK